MQLPPSLLESLKHVKGFHRDAFETVHSSGEQVTSIRTNPLKPVPQFPNFSPDSYQDPLSKIPWCQHGLYLPARPSFTFDPLFHAGCYYVQEASSMFLEQAIRQTVDLSAPLKVLDLCAAPGGKSTHIQSLISKDSLLVSNEVIRSRANILKDNIIKWGGGNVMVTTNDPKDFTALEDYFDMIVIDAPCSGSGLFRRDPAAIEEWSVNNVALCSQRQQRILADTWPALKKNGVLVYATCSFSPEEDEEIVQWIKNTFSAESILLTIANEWGIIESGEGYRFWPDKVKGEGFFLACFRKKEGNAGSFSRIKNKAEPANKNEIAIIDKWVKKDGLRFIKHLSTAYAWPEKQAEDFNFLLKRLQVIYSGVLTGELVREKLVPDHALALSGIISGAVPRKALDYENSIRFLQRKELKMEMENRGWQLVTYENHPLGWINVLPNRVNNYYPKELRILKDK